MNCAPFESPLTRFALRLALTALTAVVAAGGTESRARADEPPPSYAEGPERPQVLSPESAAPVEEPRGLVGLRVLAPVYLSDVTLVGGRDFVTADALPGVGFRFDLAGRVVAGLTLGITAGLAYNRVMRRSDSEANDSLLDVFVALLVGYRATIEELVVVAATLGAGYHSTQHDGGASGLAELEVGVRVVPNVVVGAGLTAEVLMGINQSQALRLTPAVLVEFLF
jgi:hypothetical protein